MQQDHPGWVRRQLGTRDIRPAAEPGQPEGQARGHKTFVFEGAEFEGTLRLRESFHIDSEFRGEIVSEGTVTVGKTAGIEAKIRAREVIINGAVVGAVSASRLLIIRSSGRLHGDVDTPCLEIERGAVFNGRMTMVRPEVAARADVSAWSRIEQPSAYTSSAPPSTDASPRQA
jgi:cytoskeletal protein CcmA (bactofilin family)